jgi:hypothetical protein
MAASATFALKAGVWFRRARQVIVIWVQVVELWSADKFSKQSRRKTPSRNRFQYSPNTLYRVSAEIFVIRGFFSRLELRGNTLQFTGFTFYRSFHIRGRFWRILPRNIPEFFHS